MRAGTQGDDTVVWGREGAWSRAVTAQLRDAAEKQYFNGSTQ